MMVWFVHCDWYDADDIIIGIFTNLALAAREAMRYAEDMLQKDETLTNSCEGPYGFIINIRHQYPTLDGCILQDFSGQIMFERITVNNLS